jgi:PRTRC genetic system ThiF family protein
MKRHYSHNYLLNPRHRLTVALVGAGGTGSQLLPELARIDYALYKLGHPGLSVTVYDDDVVTEANIGRQLFSPSDIGLSKAVVLVDRINSFFGLDWSARSERYPGGKDFDTHNIILTCVDNVASRKEIGECLRKHNGDRFHDDKMPLYWIDFGNQTDRGQVVLGTLVPIDQPKSRKVEVVGTLPCVDQMFDLSAVDEKDSGPSCSLAEALSKQDLFINSMLAQVGGNLLWKLITEGGVDCQGAFVNLKAMNVNPIKL